MAKLILAEPRVREMKLASFCIYTLPRDETENPFTPNIKCQVNYGTTLEDGTFETVSRENLEMTGQKFVDFVSRFQLLEPSVLTAISELMGIPGTVET